MKQVLLLGHSFSLGQFDFLRWDNDFVTGGMAWSWQGQFSFKSSVKYNNGRISMTKQKQTW